VAASVWDADIGAELCVLPSVGSEQICVLSQEANGGTIGHTGYYAVMNHTLTGNDPAVFSNMTIRPIPIPSATWDTQAHLSWTAAIQDPGEGGATNIIGYNVFRSPDGINFSMVNTAVVVQTSYNDPIPNDQNSYYYAIGLVYRGTPPVNSIALSGNVGPIPSYTIGTSSSPAAGGSTSGGGMFPRGSNVTVCATANPCYDFVSWTESGNAVSSSPCYVFSASANRNLVANFSQISYTVGTSSSPLGGGTTSGGGTVNCGSNVTVTTTANPCYSFVNWTLNGTVVSAGASYSFIASANETLVANFLLLGPYTITASNSPAGGGSASGGGAYACGADVTVCATPNPCYTFLNWRDQNNNLVSSSACYEFTAINNMTLTAEFQPVSPYTITTSNSPAGGGSASGGGIYSCGSNVTVCATANPCYSFVNWTDQRSNVVSAASCYTFAPTTNETVTANFAVNELPASSSPTSLWSFTNGLDGGNPYASLVQGVDSNFYGTTYNGGSFAVGTVFRISPSGSLTSLWEFTGSNDGANPQGGLVQGSDGNFYGTTAYGGANGDGNVFRISPSGSLTNLWSFTGGEDGAFPLAGLVQGSDGNFYGTTYGSGSGSSANGSVFRISASGSLTNLWSFTGGNDGANPMAGLVQGTDGNFYGTTYGSGSGPDANGSVFRISPSGSLTTLWSFTGGNDGANPMAGLVQGSGSNFYGTTAYGGANGYGTVFRISPSGSLTNLWSFTGATDGANPQAGLVQGTDGNFYGTTYGSGLGPSANGNVFRISPSGSLTNLWSFTGCGDGANPLAGLVQGTDSNFYGTTYGSGSGPSANGTVFKLSVSSGLPPVAMFTANPTNGVAPLTVSFTDTSSNSPTSWTWTDTNGNMSTNRDPTFTYANPGAYTVRLIACNASGCGTNTVVINVLSPVYSPFSWWQLNYFGTTTSFGNTGPKADYTGTGMNNTNKFLAGFNPTNAAAYLHIISIAATNGTNIVVTYLGASGDTNYVPGILSRTNVLDFTTGGAVGSYASGNWQDTGQTNILGVGISTAGGEGTGLGTVTNMTDYGGATNIPSRYYRVRVLLP
jgi:uncharacterized repeat protein (TIGR03803 family)